MRNNLTAKLLTATALLAGCLNADVMYSIPSADGSLTPALAGYVDFFLSGTCNVPNGTACVLNVEFVDQESSETTAAQALSGVTFTLSTAGNDLTFSGLAAGAKAADGTTLLANGLYSLMSSTNPTAGPRSNVTIVPFSGTPPAPTTTTPSAWQAEANGHTSSGTTPFWGNGTLALTVLGSGTPTNLIVGSSSGTASSFKQHTPSLLGPVYFQITDITNLTTSTDISDVTILMGTGPDSIVANANCTVNGATCSLGTGDLGGGGAVPEPASFLMAGAALIALGCMRRRFVAVK